MSRIYSLRLVAVSLTVFLSMNAQERGPYETVLDTAISVLISPRIPTYQVRIVQLERPNQYDVEYSVKVLMSHLNEPYQELQIPWRRYSIDTQSGKETHFEFTDLNFDGFLDLFISQGQSADGLYVDNILWLFDVKTHTLSENPSLSSIFKNRFSFSAFAKELTTGGREGCGGWCYSFDHYRWEGNSLFLHSRESNEQLEDGSGFVYRKLQLVDGEMKEVIREVTKSK